MKALNTASPRIKKLRAILTALGLAAVTLGVAAPAFAEDGDWHSDRDRYAYSRPNYERRDYNRWHRDWRARHPVYVGPGYVYAPPPVVYTPPPVVYAPPPPPAGISLIIPLNFR